MATRRSNMKALRAKARRKPKRVKPIEEPEDDRLEYTKMNVNTHALASAIASAAAAIFAVAALFNQHQAWVVVIGFCIVLSFMMGFSARGDLAKKSSKKSRKSQKATTARVPQKGIELANTGIAISLLVMLSVALHIITNS